ncbi:hypothetical protein GGI12_000803 [Dipsacomyces acuminosporus]|nr:hypothetical protein GGI12_000803 [Dipsacomyces acuminosporus]
MTTHDMDPPSDIDVDLSSDAGSESHIDEADAERIIDNAKLYNFGSSGYSSHARRMDFSPTPSPPPPDTSVQFPAHGISAVSNQQGFTTAPAPVSGASPTFAPTSDTFVTSSADSGHPATAFTAEADFGNSASGGSFPHSSPVHTAAAAATITSTPYITSSDKTIAFTHAPEGTGPPGAELASAQNGSKNAKENGALKEQSVDSTSSMQQASSPVAAGASATPSSVARTGIWVHFTRDPDYATNRRGRCVYCHNYYSCSSGSTGNMWRHIKRSHPEKVTNAAPLATHGGQGTPQPKAEAGASHSNRPRKRQASFSSPTADRSGGSQSLLGSGSSTQQQQQQQQKQKTHHDQQQQQPQQQKQRISATSASQTLEDALLSEVSNAARTSRLADDGDASTGAAAASELAGTNTESLAQALKLLLTLIGRNQSTADRAGSHSQPGSSLLGVLEGLNAIGAGAGSKGSTANIFAGDGSSTASDLAALARQLRSLSSSHRAGNGNGNLAPIPELPASDIFGGGRPLADGYHGAAGSLSSSSANQLARAILSAIQANSETAAAEAASPEAKNQRVLRAFVDFMVRDMVSIDRMLSPAMLQLMENISRGSTVPTASALAGELCRVKESHAAELRKRLEAVPGRISVSIGTGDATSTLSYLSVFAHWVDESFERHDVLLDWHCLDGAATSSDIISMFEGTLVQYGLFTKLGAVTTNYTREFVDFLNQAETICHARGGTFDLDRNQATCVVSTLLDAQSKLLRSLYYSDGNGAGASDTDAASAAPLPGMPLGRLRKITQALQKPGGSSSKALVELFRSRNIDLAALQVDESSLWASTLALLDSALSVRSDLSSIMRNRISEAAAGSVSEDEVITADAWLSLSQTRVLLRILDAGLASLAKLPTEFPSIVDVVPVYDVIVDGVADLLAAQSLQPGVRRSAESLHEYLVQCHPFQSSPIYRLAPVFDPRLKGTYYADHGYDQAWVDRAMRDAQGMLSEYAEPGAASSSATQPAGSRAFDEMRDDTSSDIDAQISRFVRLGEPSITKQLAADGRKRIFKRAFAEGRSELDEYFAAPLSAPNTALLSWWRINHTAFPALAKLVREYTAIPASSGPISSLLKSRNQPNFAQLSGMDKKLINVYACLHQWQGN